MFDDLIRDDKRRIQIGLGVLFGALLLIGIAWIINYRYITTGKVIATKWELKIARLQYQTVHEHDWDVPIGGRVQYTRSEYHHTHTYISGYKTMIVRGGTYSCGTSKNPRTCRRPDTTRREPVYSSYPVYKTKYYYDIDRWLNIEPLSTSGNDKELVQWPDTTDGNYNETNVIGNIKLGGKWSHYWIVIIAEGKTYERDMIDSEWYRYTKDDKIKLTLGYFNNIISVEKERF